MSPRARGRVTDCTPAQARTRRQQARAFLDVADLVLTEPATQTEPHVAAALAVLAAIAATDAHLQVWGVVPGQTALRRSAGPPILVILECPAVDGRGQAFMAASGLLVV